MAVVGPHRAGPRAEHLVHLHPHHPGLGPRVLVVPRVEHEVDAAVGGAHHPVGQRFVPGVVPLELGADLGEVTVDDHAVLRRARPLRPLAAQLQPDHRTVRTAAVDGPGVTGAPAPVPVGAVRPTTAADVEHAPGGFVVPEPADLVADDELAARRARLVLRGELERGVRPRDHDVERLVPGRELHPGVEPAGGAVGFLPRGAQLGPAGGVGHLDRDVT